MAWSCEANAETSADQHDRQPIGLHVGSRHALDVVDGDRVDAIAEVLQLLDGEPVENHVQHLHRNRVGRLDGQREAAREIRLRIGELASAHPLALQAPEFVDDEPQHFPCRLGSRVGLRSEVAALLQRAHVGLRAVGQPTFCAQHLVKPIAAFAAQDAKWRD